MKSDSDARFASWTRRWARLALRRFVGSELRPNHLTTLRLMFGFGACLAWAEGSDLLRWVGGGLWVISAFLDRCDGEFARMTGQTSRFGHIYDFLGDVVINSVAFAAIGLGLHDSDWALTRLAIPLGLLAATAVAIAALAAEFNERDMPQGVKTFNGRFGFDFDDLIYLIAVFAWCDVLGPLLIAGAIGATVAAILILAKVAQNRDVIEQND